VHGRAAFVVGTEALPAGELVFTNIFCLEAGAWRMVHHQVGPHIRSPLQRTSLAAMLINQQTATLNLFGNMVR
jgi:hypothetical protein